MVVAIAVPQEYGYVITTAAASLFISMWHGVRIGSFRKAARIPYPQCLAEQSQMASATPEQKHEMYLFNTAQRAHYNYLEHHPSFVIALLIAGLRFPIASSLLGVGWIVSRIAYAVGYTRKDRTDGKGRLVGSGFWLFQLGLFGMTAYSGVTMLL